MKTLANIFIIVIAILLHSGSCISLKAQSHEHPNDANNDYVWTYTCDEEPDKVHTIGMYGSLSGSYSQVFGDPVGYLGGRLGIVLDDTWGIGLAGYALNYDKALSTLSSDGTYRLQAGYTGIYVEYLTDITDWMNLSLYVMTGEGITFYQYDKEFREDRKWYDEIIDQETFAVFEPGVELQFRLSETWWIGIQSSYRTTSPIKLEGAEDTFLEQINTGIFFKYGLF